MMKFITRVVLVLACVGALVAAAAHVATYGPSQWASTAEALWPFLFFGIFPVFGYVVITINARHVPLDVLIGDMPLWLPDTPEYAGFMRVDCRKAQQAGLAYRPVLETARDTLAWVRANPVRDMGRAAAIIGRPGLTPERERELLDAWHAGPAQRAPGGEPATAS